MTPALLKAMKGLQTALDASTVARNPKKRKATPAKRSRAASTVSKTKPQRKRNPAAKPKGYIVALEPILKTQKEAVEFAHRFADKYGVTVMVYEK